MEHLYDEDVTRYSDSFIRVVIDHEYVIRIKSFVTKLIEAKSKESHHKIDSHQEEKRFTTGFLGEAAHQLPAGQSPGVCDCPPVPTA